MPRRAIVPGRARRTCGGVCSESGHERLRHAAHEHQRVFARAGPVDCRKHLPRPPSACAMLLDGCALAVPRGRFKEPYTLDAHAAPARASPRTNVTQALARSARAHTLSTRIREPLPERPEARSRTPRRRSRAKAAARSEQDLSTCPPAQPREKEKNDSKPCAAPLGTRRRGSLAGSPPFSPPFGLGRHLTWQMFCPHVRAPLQQRRATHTSPPASPCPHANKRTHPETGPCCRR